MHYRQLFLIIALLNLPSAAAAVPSGESYQHVESAFQFAEREDWSEAALHAKRSNDPALIKLITWLTLLDSESGASFHEFVEFITANPDWPEMKKLRQRAETSLRDSSASDDDILNWFGKEEPVTGYGKLALAKALANKNPAPKAKIETLVRDAWRDGDFDEAKENEILAAYSSILGQDDHIARADRLLWEDKTGAAKRLMPLVPESVRNLMNARMALAADKKTAPLLVVKVDGKLKANPGLQFERMRFRARRDDNNGVRDILLKMPKEVPYPEKWWRFRETQVRKAVDEDNYKTARRLLENHGQTGGIELADATWLSGWLQLEYTNEPKKAYDTFYRMYSMVRFPPSRARAAFWAGRAAEKSGDRETAANWYNTATSYPTTFYGQLASQIHNGSAPLHIPGQPAIDSESRRRFENSELARAITLSIEMQSMALANKLIGFLAENADSKEEAALAAELGRKAGYPYLGVRGAKKALQNNMILIETGYPTPKTPVDIPIERALALAIMRQESEFDPNARSSANALGYMQLLPSTAKEMAKKLEMGFAPSRLYEPDYNITVGSYYLSRLINGYDGSYVMAIAAYNAGPGNVRKWMQQFGRPGNSIDSAINWIEKIPFAETRNYVQRVLENLQIYRHIESDEKAPKLLLGEDLVR